MDKINTSWDNLMHQAPHTIAYYLSNAPAMYSIDQKLEYARLCAMDYNTATMAVSAQAIAEALHNLAKGE